MQGSRSRFPNRASSSSYGSWGGRSSRDSESEEKKQLLDVLEKFRSLRPYLTKRLKSITSAGRERELADLVDDIKYYLNVMNDMVADEHHGIDTIHSFIENVHEMIRTDPDPIENRSLNDTVDEEDPFIDQPRSPSPPSSPYGSSNSQSNPRIIPGERNDFNNPYQDNDTRHLPATDVWNSSNRDLGFTYTRRSDVDMRVHDIRAPQTEFNIGGRPSFRGNESRASSDNVDSHDKYGYSGGGSNWEDKYRERNSDIDKRFDRRERDSEYDHRTHSQRFRDGSSSRGRPGGWDIKMSTAASSAHVARQRERHDSNQWSRDRQRFPDRSFDREPSDHERSADSRESERHSLLDQDLRDGVEEPMFVRRPRSNRPEMPSTNSNDSPVHINYNHGPSNKDPTPVGWLGSDVDHRDSDMRSPTFPSPSAASVNSAPLIPPVVAAAGANVPSPAVPNVDMNVSASSNLLHPTNQFNNPSIASSFQAQMNMAQQMVSNSTFANQNQVAQLQAMMQGMTQMFQNITQQQQHGSNSPLMSPPNVNPLMINNQTPPGLASPNMNLQPNNQSNINMNSQALLSNQNINRPNIPNQNMNMGMRAPQMGGYSPNHNRFRGLLPTPAAAGDFRFQNRTGSRMPRPNLDAHPPSTMSNYPPRHSNSNVNPSSNSMFSQIRQKAQHHFSRATRPSFGRRDGPNFNNGPSPDGQSFRNPAPVQTNKPPQLATNQMLAEAPTLDPRLNRANRPIQSRDQSQNQNKELCTNNEQNSLQNDSSLNSVKKPSESVVNKRPTEHSRHNEVAKNNSEKGRLNNPPPKKVDKVNKLSEFKEQIAKEDMIKLGDKSSKTKIRFEEALCLAPSKSTKKSPAVVKSKPSDGPDNNNKVLGSQKNTTTDKEKTKPAKNVDSKLIKSRNSRSAADNHNRLKNLNSKQPKKSSPQLKTSDELSKTAKTGATFNFKIPKIKKPPPPVEVIPEETPPPTMESQEIEEQIETPDKDEASCQSSSKSMPDKGSTQGSSLSLGDNAEELIKTFITKSMAPDDVERLNSNPDAYLEIAKKLQEHLKKIVTSDMDDKSSPSTSDQGSSKSGNTSETERESSVDKTGDSPPAKKKCGKRRSDLEKLHEALKEMRFDSMLPLGPRKCTNKNQMDEQLDGDNVVKETVSRPEDLPTAAKVFETAPLSKSSIDEIIEEQANMGACKSLQKKAKSKKGALPKKNAPPKLPLKSKKVVPTKKQPAMKKGKQAKVERKSLVRKAKSSSDLSNSTESEEVSDPPKAKRGRKRKVTAPSNEASDVLSTDSTAADSTAAENANPSPPKRYLTRLQAKQIANPPSPEAPSRTNKTGWETWNKKLAVLKKRQEKRNKKFVATFNASRIKLKLKNQLKRKNDKIGLFPKQTGKKSKLGSNSIAVNSGLGKIKMEADYSSNVRLKPENVNTPESNDNADMNHLMIDPEKAVISVVNFFEIEATPVDEVADVALDLDSSQTSSLPEVTDADFESADFTAPEFETGFDKDTEIVNPELQENDMEVLRSMEQDVHFESSLSNDDPPPPELEIAANTPSAAAPPGPRRGRVRKIRSDLFSCRLCPFNGKKIVAHYVNLHRDETIPEVSISQEAFDNLVAQNLSTAPQLFDISYCDSEEENPWPCLYCNEKYKDVLDYWEHLTTHTGEYLYSCGVCGVRHPYYRTMMSHLKTHKLKEGELVKNLINLYEPTVSAGGHELFAYMCKDCRYFQLLTENIASHLDKEQHTTGETISLKFHGPRLHPDQTEKREIFDTSVFLGSAEKMLKMEEELQKKREAYLTVENVDNLNPIKAEFLKIASRVQEIKCDNENLDDDISEIFEVESNNQVNDACKETVNWILGIVESRVEPNLSFDKEFVSLSKHNVITALFDESECDEDDSDDDCSSDTSFNNTRDEQNSSLQKCQGAFQKVLPQDQFQIIVKYRNNENAIIDHEWPKFVRYSKDLVGIKRIGDGFEHACLLNGFVPRIIATGAPASEFVSELHKLQLGCFGEKRIALKEAATFKSMLTPEKLRQLFKCMGTSCSYTTDNEENFIFHLIDHGMKREMRSLECTPIESWNCCSYCNLQYKSAKDLCDHIRNQHCRSLFQCSYCFFRAFSDKYVDKHQELDHANLKPKLLCCVAEINTNFVENRKATFNAYKCMTCTSEQSKNYHMRDEFLRHIQKCNPSDLPYTCHLCGLKYADKRHLVYHYKQHSIFRYQCAYCKFGSEIQEDMEKHFYDVHPNLSGRLLDRDPHNNSRMGPPTKVPELIDLSSPDDTKGKPTVIDLISQASTPSKISLIDLTSPASTPSKKSVIDLITPVSSPSKKSVIDLITPVSSPSKRSVIGMISPASSPSKRSVIDLLTPASSPSKRSVIDLISPANSPSKRSVIDLITPVSSPSKRSVLDLASPVHTHGKKIVIDLRSPVHVDLVTPDSSPTKRTRSATALAKEYEENEEYEDSPCRRLSFDAEDKEGRITNLEGTNLYRCGNNPCAFSSLDANSYKDHAASCLNEAGLIPCGHCSRKMKSVFSLMEHLKVHGKQRQFCSLCSFKCCVNSELTKHFKSVHRVSNYRVLKSEENANDPEATVYPRETLAKVLLPDVLQATHMLYSNKALFTPSDIDKIPSSSIFSSFVHCGLCPFNTKVRSNLVRHLNLHLQSEEEGGKMAVANTVPVNPVPCLSRNEMFFDKMTNWAGSSHQKNNGSGVSKEDASKLPQFVKEQFRFQCSVSNCQHITVDDSMLKAHMRALHSDVDVYKCPHCLKNGTSDSRNSVPIDRIGIHLKLHGPKLYRCGHCDYIQTQTRLVEKHVAEKHVEKKPIHYLIRDFDDDGNIVSRRVSVEENPKPNDAWRCTLCAYKTQFTNWDDAKHHCTKSHNVQHQLLCSGCGYSSDLVFQMVTHVQKNECPEVSSSAEKGRVLIMFCRNHYWLTGKW